MDPTAIGQWAKVLFIYLHIHFPLHHMKRLENTTMDTSIHLLFNVLTKELLPVLAVDFSEYLLKNSDPHLKEGVLMNVWYSTSSSGESCSPFTLVGVISDVL